MEAGAGGPCHGQSGQGPRSFTHVRLPGDTGCVVLLHVCLQSLDDCDKRLAPSDDFGLSVTAQPAHQPLTRATHVSLKALVTLSAQNCDAFFISAMYGAGAGSCKSAPATAWTASATYHLDPTPGPDALAHDAEACTPLATLLAPPKLVFRLHDRADGFSLRLQQRPQVLRSGLAVLRRHLQERSLRRKQRVEQRGLVLSA